MTNKEKTIYPTHECFDDALENLIFLMKRDGREPVKNGEVLIVHAIIAPEGEDMAHAWIENQKSVFFSGILEGENVLCEVDIEEYYSQSHVKRAIKYTLFQAYAEEQQCGHYGPWDKEIKKLTKHG